MRQSRALSRAYFALVALVSLTSAACSGASPDPLPSEPQTTVSPSPSEGGTGGARAGVYSGVATLTSHDSAPDTSSLTVGDSRDAELHLFSDCDGEQPCEIVVGNGFVEILPSPSAEGQPPTIVGSILELTPTSAGYSEQATFESLGLCPIAVTRTTQLVLDEGTAVLTITIAPETLEKTCDGATSFGYGGTVEFEGTLG